MMFSHRSLICDLSTNNITVSTMESCTGGMLCDKITDVENCSKTLIGGYITYNNEQKIRCGVPKEIIDKYGVYSKECAVAMAMACKVNTNSTIGIGVTGVLGNPDNNNLDGKLGVVYFGIVSDITTEFYQTKVDISLDRHKQKELVSATIFETLQEYILQGKC